MERMKFLLVTTSDGWVKKVDYAGEGLIDKRIRLPGPNARLQNVSPPLIDGTQEYYYTVKGGYLIVGTTGHSDIFLTTDHGFALRFPESDIRPMGAEAAGVQAIRLDPDDTVVSVHRYEDVEEAFPKLPRLTRRAHGVPFMDYLAVTTDRLAAILAVATHKG